VISVRLLYPPQTLTEMTRGPVKGRPYLGEATTLTEMTSRPYLGEATGSCSNLFLSAMHMIYESGVISLIVQIIVGIIDYVAINLKIDSKDEILKDLLKMELFVQIVEFIFYVWLIYHFHKVSKNITPYRYLDWSITTPLNQVLALLQGIYILLKLPLGLTIQALGMG
jgi:hypothetical protein